MSLAPDEFKAAGSDRGGLPTKQGAFLDGFDKPELREEGTEGLLDQVGGALERDIV